MKFAIVIQRYGQDLTGGSEHLCRMIAERMSARGHHVDILTTCARDYISWKNEYLEGRSTLNGVNIVRFPTTRTRDLESFNAFSEKIYDKPHTPEDEQSWLEQQGPVCPSLVEYLKAEQEKYERIIFFTYLYYPTYHGLKIAPEKSVLIPTAHNEPAIRLGIFKQVFSLPYALIFNTAAEKEFANSQFQLTQPQEVAGVGVDIPAHVNRKIFRRKQGLIEDYFYYGGRIDAGKGCAELIDFYLKKKERSFDFPLLLLSGHLTMDLPSDPSVIYLGYLSEQEKMEALQGAVCTFIPSVMESLSLLLLESFASRTPVVVRENSPVLKQHCVNSNAGLYYNDFDEFSACVDYLLERPKMRDIFGRNGRVYVEKNYSWPRVLSLYERVLSLKITENATL